MPHGTPDYGVSAARSTIFPVIDLGELAVRLGSPSAYDRQGNVFYLDSFENGLAGWNTATSGSGGSVGASFGRGLHTAWAGHLVPGSDADRYAEISRGFSFPVLSNIGVEVAFTLAPQLQDVIIYLDFYTGALRLRYGFRYDKAVGQGYIWIASGAWQAVGSPAQALVDDKLFIPTKFVADPITPRYLRLLVGLGSLSVSSYGPQSTVDTTLAHLAITGRVVANAGFNPNVYFDRFILTQNEV